MSNDGIVKIKQCVFLDYWIVICIFVVKLSLKKQKSKTKKQKMKKILSMFAFAAVIVLGAFTLASCVKDEADDPNATHNFTLDAIMESNLASVRESAEFKKDNANIANEIRAQFKELQVSSMTNTQAVIFWSKLRDDRETKQKVQDFLDKIAAGYKDRTLTLTLIFKRNGAEWRTATWTTTYKDNY